MRVSEIAPGLWRWTGLHPDWTPQEGGPEGWEPEVGCVYYEAPDAIVLVDPLVPPEDRDRFLQALDRDVQRARRTVHILLTIFWHSRGARELADRYGAEIWAHERVLAEDRREVDPTRTFSFRDELPGGIIPFDAGRADEAVLWIPAFRALVFGDVVLGSGGAVRLCPESWLRAGNSHARLRQTLRPLLELPVTRLLVSHGDPVLENGRNALDRVLGEG